MRSNLELIMASLQSKERYIGHWLDEMVRWDHRRVMSTIYRTNRIEDGLSDEWREPETNRAGVR